MRPIILAVFLILSSGVLGCGERRRRVRNESESSKQSTHAENAADRQEVAFISSDFLAALIVRPRQILSSAKLTAATAAKLVDRVEEKTGFNPRELTRFTVLLENPQPGEDVEVAMIARFSRPVVPEKDLARVLPNFKIRNQGRLKVYVGRQDYFGAALADENTLVIARTQILDEMVSARNVDSPLIRQLRSLAPDSDLFAAFVPSDPLRQLIASPPDNVALSSMAVMVAGFTMRFPDVQAFLLQADVSQRSRVVLSLLASSEDAAIELEKAAHAELEKAKRTHPSQLLPASTPPEVRETMKQILNSMRIQRAATKMTVQANIPAGAVDLLAGTVAAARTREQDNGLR